MNIKTYKPKIEDLWFKKEMLSDSITMSYNHAYGGTIDFPKSEWNDWYDYWIINNENKRFYRYLVNNYNDFVGEIAYHFDGERYIIDILVHAKYRNHGYGSMGLELLLKEAKNNGIKVVYDDIATDNPSINLFIKFGFIVCDVTSSVITIKKELI